MQICRERGSSLDSPTLPHVHWKRLGSLHGSEASVELSWAILDLCTCTYNSPLFYSLSSTQDEDSETSEILGDMLEGDSGSSSPHLVIKVIQENIIPSTTVLATCSLEIVDFYTISSFGASPWEISHPSLGYAASYMHIATSSVHGSP